MTVRVGETWSTLRPVNRGCPQGSVLGVFLFNVTTEDLEDGFIEREQERLGTPPQGGEVRMPEAVSVELDESLFSVGSPTASTPPAAPAALLPQPELSPVGENLFRHSDLIIHFNKYTKNTPQPPLPHFTPQPREKPVGTQVLTEKMVVIVKYVDDNIIIEKVNFGNEPIVVSGGRQIKRKRAAGVQNAFVCIVSRAEYKGMLVNAEKNQSYLYLRFSELFAANLYL